MIASEGLNLIGGAGKQAREAIEREGVIDWLGNSLIKTGTLTLVAGVILSGLAYMLNGFSAKALNDAGAQGAAITGVFSNVGYDPSQMPMLPIVTSSPVEDMSNFGQDVYRVFSNAGSDVTAGLQAVATALADIPRALVAIGAHGPSMVWSELTGLVAEAIGDLFTFIFPWLIIFGLILAVAGAAIKAGKWLWVHLIYPEGKEIIDYMLARALAPFRERVERFNAIIRAKTQALPPPVSATLTPAPAPAPALAPALVPAPSPVLASEPVDPPAGSTEEVLGNSMPEPSLSEARDRMRLAMVAGAG